MLFRWFKIAKLTIASFYLFRLSFIINRITNIVKLFDLFIEYVVYSSKTLHQIYY